MKIKRINSLQFAKRNNNLKAEKMFFHLFLIKTECYLNSSYQKSRRLIIKEISKIFISFSLLF